MRSATRAVRACLRPQWPNLKNSVVPAILLGGRNVSSLRNDNNLQILAQHDHRAVVGSVHMRDEGFPSVRFAWPHRELRKPLASGHNIISLEHIQKVLRRAIAQVEVARFGLDQDGGTEQFGETAAPRVRAVFTPAGGGVYFAMVLNICPTKPSNVQFARLILPPDLQTRRRSVAASPALSGDMGGIACMKRGIKLSPRDRRIAYGIFRRPTVPKAPA